MTTSKTGPTTGPAPVDYPIPFRKGTWLARIDGPHGRYGLDRAFLEGATNKKAGRVTHQLTPGWYEYQHKPGERSILAVDTAGQIHELDHPGGDRDTLRPLGKAAKRGETIDTPGAYAGRTCWCGAEATHHQPKDGRARCADHYKPPASEEEPPPSRPYDPADDHEPPPGDIPADWLNEWHNDDRSTAA